MDDLVTEVLNCPGHTLAPEEVAQAFHEEYERLAPSHGYETRRESAVPWAEVPEPNRDLMIATVKAVIGRFFPEHLAAAPE
jgi:hypothetical protein